jgi:RNA polymerase sigma factor (sigma-70 family)
VVVEDVRQVFLSLRLRLARVASKIVPPDEVEDIVQEAYVRLCQVDEKKEIRHPKSYLCRIVRNLALDYVKRADQRLNTQIESDDDLPEERDGTWSDVTFVEAASLEEFGQFCDAVRALPIQCRRVFILKKVYNYSQREIANELGISQSTVEKHVALGVRRCMEFVKLAETPVGRPETARSGVVPLSEVTHE